MASHDTTSEDPRVSREEILPIILEPEVDLEPESDTTPDIPLHSISTEESSTMKEVHVPTHPIASMQGAFAESLLEVSGQSTPTIPKTTADSATRRKQLLEQGIAEETHASRWRQKPGQRYHELWKLMSQISFGVYLLFYGIAKNDDQVLSILQGHVDQVDGFLETTLEDFDLAQEDIDERLKRLMIPLENIQYFDMMLEGREYRNEVVTGNERIEHIIHRTASAMKDALKDVQQGLDATKEFALYLVDEKDNGTWKDERPDMLKVWEAMKGNSDGWVKAYVSLQTKGNHLGVSLVQLGSVVAEMDKRAGEVSRRTRFSIIPESTPKSTELSPPSSPPRSSHHSRISLASLSKELPSDPVPITPAIRATLPAFQYVSERERTPSPEPEESVLEEEPDLSNFTLQPRTYSPAPPVAPLQQPLKEPKPVQEVSRRTSLRQRFSLKRKTTPSTLATQSNVSEPKRPPPIKSPSYPGHDSAYCSDSDKIVSRTDSMLEESYFQARPAPQPPLNFDSPFVTSPRSDQQTFRPVQASPHSPLQRPWTAAPLLESNLRHSSGTMLSSVSQMTTDNGKKVKKKKSGFGWLKKAFSLSEEERAEFEAKRRQGPPIEYVHPPRQFLDGKRVR